MFYLQTSHRLLHLALYSIMHQSLDFHYWNQFLLPTLAGASEPWPLFESESEELPDVELFLSGSNLELNLRYISLSKTFHLHYLYFLQSFAVRATFSVPCTDGFHVYVFCKQCSEKAERWQSKTCGKRVKHETFLWIIAKHREWLRRRYFFTSN